MRLLCAGTLWPSRAARTSHAPLAPPEAGARPLTPRRARRSAPLTAVCAHCTSACTFFRHHTAPERDATGKTLHREARAAARRARRPPSTLSVTRAGLLCSLHAACTAALPGLNHSARVLRTAPQPPRACTTQILHCTRRARGTLRARSAIRSVCCPVCLHTAQSTCKEPKVHVHAAQSPHSDAARTPRQSPASRRASACRTQYCAHCSIFVTKRKQKSKTKTSTPPKKNLNKQIRKVGECAKISCRSSYDKRPFLVKS